LIVVFDEAHHSPAPSYRELLAELRRSHPNLLLLGLTATPTYSDESKRGWLKKLFPQGILHQVSAKKLLLDGVLAKPIFENHERTLRRNGMSGSIRNGSAPMLISPKKLSRPWPRIVDATR
jgi:ATP-dependent helicase IRC3